MIDWGAGNYESTAAELEPVAQALMERAALRRGEEVIDLACGTGNVALLAASQGARVTGIDAAARLLGIARERAQARRLEVDFRVGDLLDLPVADASADAVVSVFGIIFAPDPVTAMREVGRVVRPGGRVLISAWIPAGPIDAMLGALGRVVGRVTQAPPAQRFAWFDGPTVGALAAHAGLTLQTSISAELAISDSSPEAYIAAGQEHPMALAVRPVLERAGVIEEAQGVMTSVLREANERPDAFLVHSPYVIHELSRDRGSITALA